MLQGNGRGTVIGQNSFGSTGQPLFFDLPGGGNGRICTVDCRYPDGSVFVGPGIKPDVVVERTVEGIASGRDETLEAALDYLRKQGALQ